MQSKGKECKMDSFETSLFGGLLKSFRQRMELTQSTLAHKIEKHSRGSIQAWESSLYLPSDRGTVLALARALQLSESETDRLLLAAHYPQEYHTQETLFSAPLMREALYMADIYIYEHDDAPVLDITLHNRGTQTALLTGVQVDILDTGEFYYCDEEDEDEDDLTRSFMTVSSNYDVKLSPAFKGKQVSVKIAHQLRADEADRFQLRIGQHFLNPRLAYVWYYLKIAIVYNTEHGRTIEAGPVLLSVPPVGIDSMDVWTSLLTPCVEQNRATLSRMSMLSKNRSHSVETTIRQVLGE
jgi:DNA-binding XRE family transcriptional regulator